MQQVKEEVTPRRTSSRQRGTVADSDFAKRKAGEDVETFKEANRQRVNDNLNMSDIVVAGRQCNQSGDFPSDVSPAQPSERTFHAQDIKETSDKKVHALRKKMSGIELNM